MAFFLGIEKFPLHAADDGFHIQIFPVALQIVHHFIRHRKQIRQPHIHALCDRIFLIFLRKVAIHPIQQCFRYGNQHCKQQAEGNQKPQNMIKNLRKHFL